MAQWGDTDTLADAPKHLTPSVSFDATDAGVVVLADDKIVVADHGFKSGDRVTYTSGAADITGLTSGTMYYVIRSSETEIKLAATHAHAIAGTPVIALTGQGGGTDTLQETPHNDSADESTVVFVDTTEASQAANKAKGLGTPGWNSYRTYTTGDGRTRHIAESLVSMKRTVGDAGDLGITGTSTEEDVFVLDRTITIDTQPLAADAIVDIAGTASMTLSVAATADPAQAVTFQWEFSSDAGTTYANVALASTAATLVVDSTEVEYVAGNLFRCVVSTQGAVDVTSNAVTLTQS